MTMRLSQALQFGEFLLAPAHGVWLGKDTAGNVCKGCAIGRACIAAGFQPLANEASSDEWLRLNAWFSTTWPWTVDHIPVVQPVFARPGYTSSGPPGFGTANPLLADVSNLYEQYDYTMLQLAEWVARIEPVESTPPIETSLQLATVAEGETP